MIFKKYPMISISDSCTLPPKIYLSTYSNNSINMYQLSNDQFNNSNDQFNNYTILHHHNYLKYSFDLSWSGIIVFAPGFQPAGHTTPCSSACLKARIVRRVQSTLRPTCSSLIVIERITPLPSIMKSPLRVAPLSGSFEFSTRTPYLLDISFVMSATRGMSSCPNPPFYLAVFLHARCEK